MFNVNPFSNSNLLIICIIIIFVISEYCVIDVIGLKGAHICYESERYM